MNNLNNKNKILAFIGDGEGKTSAAIGHAVRAAGHDKKVAIIQFLKGLEKSGEYKFLSKNSSHNNIEIFLAGSPQFVIDKKPDQKHIDKAKEGLALAKKLIESGKYFLIVLDEILDAADTGLISINDIIGIFNIVRAEHVPPQHLIITGRILPPEISTYIDLITRMQKIKHYYDRGEKGIEGLDY
jgi:cob(I)alamin adenosyltransferase